MSDNAQSMGRPMLTVSAGILASRVLGLVRDVVFAHVWGTSAAMAGFVIAFTIPNLLRALFGEGAFSAAFVPAFSHRLEKEGKAAAWRTACQVISVLALVLAGLCVLATLVAWGLRLVLHGEVPRQTLRLLPGLLPYALLICVVGAFSGVLNSLRRFVIPAFTPLVMNVFMVLGALYVCPAWGRTPEEQIIGMVPVVLLSGVVQVAVQMAGCRAEGLVFRFEPAVHSPEVRRIASLMLPALLGTGVVQMNVMVDRCMAGFLGSAATSSLYYSERLIYLPVGLFGVAMSVVCLPAMSRAWARGERESMLDSLRYSLRHTLFLAAPVVALLVVFCVPIIRLLLERGLFNAESTRETAWATWFYLPGIPAFACAKIAVTPFYARQDTRTPVRIALSCLALNVVLNLTLMQFLRQGGLALSTSICSYVNVALLLWRLRRDLGPLGLRQILPNVVRIVAASGLAGLAGWVAWRWLPWPHTGRALLDQGAAVLGPLAVGGVGYVGAAWALRCAEFRELLRSVLGRLGR